MGSLPPLLSPRIRSGEYRQSPEHTIMAAY
jgi:hypothetical protein